MALDRLLQGERVIHVSFSAHTSYVIAWYENIFAELAKRRNLEHIDDVKDELVRNRVIMNFAQEGVSIDQILRSLRHMIVDGGFKASTLIVDGFDFTRSTAERMSLVKQFAVEMGLEIWYSCTLAGEEPLLDKHRIPVILRDFLPSISVVIVLEPRADYIQLDVVKDHDRLNPNNLNLKLDAKTLLIATT
jgi:hypothetical protein